MYNHTPIYEDFQSRPKKRPITMNQLLSWKIVIRKDDHYYATNAFHLLEGSSDAAIQCAVFKGTTRGDFLKRQNMEGPIFEQIEVAYQFVIQNLPAQSEVKGLFRHEKYALPEAAIREAIANAVCHRSYLIPRKIQVALYDDRLEVTSPGTLNKDITLEKMREGMSSVRNKGIAEAFIYMRIVETWGSGIPNIFKAMQEYNLPEPEMQDFHGDFRITLSWNRKLPNPTQSLPNPTQSLPNPTQYSKKELLILQALKSNPSITQGEMAQSLGMDTNQIKYYLNKLKNGSNPAIRHIGTTRNGYWEVLVEITEK